MMSNLRSPQIRPGRLPALGIVPLALALTAVLAPAAMGLSLVEDCDVPLFIAKGDVKANLMILMDNSVSMNEILMHPDYDPGTTYPGDFDSDADYYIWSSGGYTVNGKTVTLVSAPNGKAGIYPGNYLNWIYWVATADQLDEVPEETKLDVAMAAMLDLVASAQDVNLGLSVFNFDNGATILAECGADSSFICNQIRNVAGTAYTPMGEAMEDLLDYFSRTDPAAPIQYDCQKSFIILMTDGWSSMDTDVSSYLWDADGDGNDPGSCTSIGAPYSDWMNCSDHVDDVAYHLRHTDLVDWLGEEGESWDVGQTVVTYTVGFTVDNPLLEETALNGDGLYLTTKDYAELKESLQAIMINVRGRIAAGAAVAVVSSETSDADYLFRGKFNPGEWMGFLECFELPYKDKEQPVWDAGEILSRRDPGDRNIYTAIGTTIYEFDAGNAGQLKDDMLIGDADECVDVIQWTRGVPVDGYRLRKNDWKLGDIIQSAPVVVGSPTYYVNDLTLLDFVNSYQNREKVIYVGANDGMMHCFNATTGVEKWAFIPEFALPHLKTIADRLYCHKYTVDQTPRVYDAKIGGDWTTVLVGSAGSGGPHFFALDVTLPSDPKVMWQHSLNDSLQFWSEPEFAHIAGRDVILVGTGYDPGGGRAEMVMLDLVTGAELSTLRLSLQPGTRNMATAASPVDRDFDGNTDVAYIADLLGTVYRIEFNGSTSAGSWNVTELYSGSQPITAQPKAAYGELGVIWVFFGTGVYMDENDMLTTNQNTFYGVMDRHDGSSNPTLIDQTNEVHDLGDADGWYVDLVAVKGERVVKPAAVAAGFVFFTTFTPNTEPCRSGGESFLYAMEYDTGGIQEEENAKPGQRQYKFRGGGIASKPVLDVVNGTVIVQNSNQTIIVQDIGVAYSPLRVKSWQEDYQKMMEESGADIQ